MLLTGGALDVRAAEQQKFVYINLFSIAGNDQDLNNDWRNLGLDKLLKFDSFIMRSGFAWAYAGSTATNRPTLWRALKAEHPDIKIYIYSNIDHRQSQEVIEPYRRSFIARVYHTKASDVPPPGTLDNTIPNSCNKDLHLYSAANKKIYGAGNPSTDISTTHYKPQFGDPCYITWWADARVNDLRFGATVANPRGAMDGLDGTHMDNLKAWFCSGGGCNPDKPKTVGYRNSAEWFTSVEAFYKGAEKALRARTGGTFHMQPETAMTVPESLSMWRALNAASAGERPGQLMTEFMFVLSFPERATHNFRYGDKWKATIEMLKDIDKVEVVSQNGSVEQKFADQPDDFGQKTTEEDALHYALGSFLLVKRNSPRWYFGFNRDDSDPGLPWRPEFDALNNGGHLDFGAPVDVNPPYKTFTHDGETLYYREFANGYVLVNPSDERVDDIPVRTRFGPVRQIKRTHIDSSPVPLTSIPEVSTLTLKKVRAAFLRKVGK